MPANDAPGLSLQWTPAVGAWEDFVQRHPHGNIFQSPSMHEVWRLGRRHEPFVVAAVDRCGRIAGIASFFVQRQIDGPLGFFTSRTILWGGPLVLGENPEALALLLGEFEARARRAGIYSQVRNLWEQGWEQPVFEAAGFPFEDHLNIEVDLGRDEETLWREVGSKRRNEIRRARRAGTTCAPVERSEDYEECLAILREVYRRVRLPLPDRSVFDALWSELRPRGLATFFGAFHGGRVVGTMVALRHGDVLLDWYQGSRRAAAACSPNDLLPWEVFLWAKRQGCRTFDWGGAGAPGERYGVRDYKKQYGGSLCNPGRYEKVHHPVLTKAAMAGLQAYRLLCGAHSPVHRPGS